MAENDQEMTGDWRMTYQVFIRYRFLGLFSSLILIMLLIPGFDHLGASGRSSAVRLIDLLLFTVMYAVIALCGPSRSPLGVIIRILAVISVIAVVLDTIFADSSETVIPRSVLGTLMMCYMTVVLLRYVLTTTSVTADTIFASLCAYLLLGFVWANFYSIVLYFDPDALSLPFETGMEREVRIGSAGSTSLVYFSFVTLTTLGFGDVVPQSPFTMMLSVIESAIGQIYLAVLVARLVGIQITRSVAE